MAIKVSWMSQGFKPEKKTIELPDHATNIRTEWGGWITTTGVYLWWKEYGIDKCKKLISTKTKKHIGLIIERDD